MMGVPFGARACQGQVTIADGARATQVGAKAPGDGTVSIGRKAWVGGPRASLASIAAVRAMIQVSKAGSGGRSQTVTGARWGSCCQCPNGGAA
jgi:hypothetical protein